MSAERPEVRYPYVLVEVAESEAEEAGARLFDLGATGIEQRDPTTRAPADARRAILAAAFEDDEGAHRARGELPAAWQPRVDHVVGDGWRDEWKKYFEPFRLCDGIVVRPPWRSYEAAAGERVLLLEPGRAFGTGLHETTRLVAEALAERRSRVRGADVLDVGCGSGILTLVALALGARSVRAIDVDPEAVAVTLENAQRNRQAGRVRADATPIGAVSGTYPVIVANVDSPTLCALAPSILARLAPAATLVLSGILGAEVSRALDSAAEAPARAAWPDVRRAYGRLALEETKTRGDWLAAVLCA